MRISIITATYNSEKTIRDTLKSLEKQSYPDIEYIIMDGASKDNTLTVVKANCSRVSKIICEPDNGIRFDTEFENSVVTGDVIGFLHSDDLLAYDDVIADIVDTFKQKGCDAVYGDLEYVSQNDIQKRVRLWKSGSFSRIKMQLGWMPPHPSFYMKKSFYVELVNCSLEYRISADYDSLLRYILKNRICIAYLPKVLVKMRVGGISNRSLSSMMSKSLEDIRIMRTNGIIWPLALAYKNLSKLPQFIKK